MDELIRGDADLYGLPVDSGFEQENIEDAEWLVANLPGTRRFHDMPTYERALVCHVVARFRLRAIASARIMGDKDRENPVERPRPALEPSEDVVEALRELIDAIDKARNLVPDDEEGLAASIFCYHLNAAQARARRVLWAIEDEVEEWMR